MTLNTRHFTQLSFNSFHQKTDQQCCPGPVTAPEIKSRTEYFIYTELVGMNHNME